MSTEGLRDGLVHALKRFQGAIAWLHRKEFTNREFLPVINCPTLDQVVAAMLKALSAYLPPPPAPPLPGPSLSVASVNERAAGLGKWRGADARAPLGVVALKGIRLDAVAQFQLWASGPVEVDKAITDLNTRLLADRDSLRANGFLRLGLEAAPPAEQVPPPTSAWRKHADYRVLYEFAYEDTDGADSLIARILRKPISIDSQPDEWPTVADEMTRWDNTKLRPPDPPLPGTAPNLAVRGPFSVGSVSALAFVPGPGPTGTVTLTRTFDGAVGPPTTYPALAKFLAAVAGPSPPQRHARFTFGTLKDFLDALPPVKDPGGNPVTMTMGDWDGNGVPDHYSALALGFDPPIVLPGVVDRFEIAYQHAAFDNVAVVYLRAGLII